MVKIYSVVELMSLRPQKPGIVEGPLRPNLSKRENLYYHLWSRYQKLLKEGPNNRVKPETHIEYKYDYILSNRAFKARWIRIHGGIQGLKDVPKRPVMSFSKTVTFLQTYFRELNSLSRRIDNLRPKLLRSRDQTRRSAGESPDEKLRVGPFSGRQHKLQRTDVRASVEGVWSVAPSRQKPKTRKAGQIHEDHMGQYAKYLGGVAIPIPPKPEWKKYWYFKRKRGYYTFSEHHPYGDEISYLKDNNIPT